MRRRRFLQGVAASAAWSSAARAQQPSMPVIGFLGSGSPEADADVVAAFRKGLAETDYIEDRNVAIEYRWARNDYGALQGLLDELVRRRVTVIAAAGSEPTRAAVTERLIPIVFATGHDPIQTGLVTSLNRPGGNVTGITTLNAELGTKWLGLFHDLLPSTTRFALFTNFDDRIGEFAANVKPAVLSKGWQIEILNVNTDDEIDSAFATLVNARTEALLIAPGGFVRSRLAKVVTLTTRHAIPAIYPIPQFAQAGGLMSYGTNYVDIYRQAGVYVGTILKGTKPADLPVLQPTKFKFVINLTTAKALGVTFPPGLLAIADEVIE